jgi:hypothetical protein
VTILQSSVEPYGLVTLVAAGRGASLPMPHIVVVLHIAKLTLEGIVLANSDWTVEVDVLVRCQYAVEGAMPCIPGSLGTY